MNTVCLGAKSLLRRLFKIVTNYPYALPSPVFLSPPHMAGFAGGSGHWCLVCPHHLDHSQRRMELRRADQLQPGPHHGAEPGLVAGLVRQIPGGRGPRGGTARGMGAATRPAGAGDVLVLDAQGNVILDSGSLTPRRTNLGDRDYFLAFSERGERELFFGKPVPSRVTGLNILPISRPYLHADGSFAGVVVGAIRLSYFNELFGSLDLGSNSGVNMFRRDGVVISRFPYGDADVGKTIAGTPNLLRFQAEGTGSFVGKAVLDGVERLYSFRPVGNYN